ncbi:uncharacterized protein [Apostichopus japonicus]|uniref:uncharacterized protein isoform X1 n=1 Tax=Stichopus japonicus TaxID=307972 RepID=UPI003AB7834C
MKAVRLYGSSFIILCYIAVFIDITNGVCRVCEFHKKFPNATKSCKNMRETCPVNMVKGTCSNCQGTCADPNKLDGCHSSCEFTQTCVCPEGYLLKNSSCVAPDDCPMPSIGETCPVNMVKGTCSNCQGTCADPNKLDGCHSSCEFTQTCVCPEGYLLKNSSCVAPDDCPMPSIGETCPVNMVQGTCSNCQGTCADPNKLDGCHSSCEFTQTCVCPEGYLLKNSSCVASDDCPMPSIGETCPVNMVKGTCSNCQGTCADPNKLDGCHSSCDFTQTCVCPEGYLLKNSSCVAPDDCPMPSIGETCPVNMVQGLCSNCQGTCADPNKLDGCHSSCEFTQTCVCPEGYLLKNSSCVVPDDCGRCIVLNENVYIQCSSNGSCLAKDGIRRCNCNPGYTGDGVTCQVAVYSDCSNAYTSGVTEDGVYEIMPTGWTGQQFNAYCEMNIDGGGWTVIQRRVDGSVLFNRNWDEYKEGFGTPEGETWLGNDKISFLTSSRNYEFRVDVISQTRGSLHTKYDLFRIGNEDEKYKLTLGTIGESTVANHDYMDRLRGVQFTTMDQDNDAEPTYNCATRWGGGGGWWLAGCSDVFFNGLYNFNDWNGICVDAKGSIGKDCGLTYVEMKIRPVL